jgi:hypothetical protein
VPRFESDEKEFGASPTSYISSMVLTNLFFVTNEDKSAYPWMAAGIWDNSISNWASAWAHPGNTGNLEHLSATYTFNTTNPNAKQAIDNEMWSGEAHTMTSDRETYVGYATVEIADAVAPKMGSFVPSEGWVNNTAPAIPYSVTDTGLGVKEFTIAQVGGTNKWTFALTCSGNVSYPCPRSWKSGETYPTLPYVPSSLPQGINKMTATAKDPTGNSSAPYEFSLKVDHTAPGLTLSGTMTQQVALGYKRPQYVLHLDGTDGNATTPQAGIASSEITVDGKVVDSTKAGCATQNCTLSRDWTLKSSAYTMGEHKIVASVTDGAGITTTKSLTIKVEKDTTPPVLTTWGTLQTAPEGWVEQINRGIAASAADGAGYGVTSLAFSIDGKVIKSASQSCASGGCESKWEAAVNMATYVGGAHSAEVVAIDGAGNVTKKTWTVNVDPKGAVSAAEAVDTIEAVEETSEATPIAPTDELIGLEERAEGNDPGLKEAKGGFQSTGTPLESLIPSEPSEGVTLESSDGSIKVIEMGTVPGSPPSVASEVASVDPNTSTQVDSIVRPIYDGDQGFKVIRDVTAPTKYSWEVLLNAGQKLEQVDPQDVAVFWGNGDRALLISAEKAHDATGKEVPTELTAEGSKVITLTVKHTSASFVYPVLAGPSFQSSYTEVIVWDPQLEQEEAEAKEAAERIEVEYVPPVPVPVPDPEPEAGISSRRTQIAEAKMRKCQTYVCAVGFWEAHLEEAFLFNGTAHVTGGQAWHDTQYSYHHCNNYSATQPWSISLNECTWIGNHAHYYRENAHYMCAQSIFHANDNLSSEYHAMTFHNFGDGYAKSHQNSECKSFIN